MIEKLNIKNGGVEDLLNCIKKINEVIDVVNALIKENNIHEMQIDELQMKLEPEKCEMCDEMMPQELLDLLERTRKALDVLLLTINRLENQNYKDCAWHLRLAIAKIKATGIADTALEQITALEQKD